MTKPSIEVTGLKEVSRTLRDLGDKDAAKATRAANKAAADMVVDAALPKVPRKTGRAAASLRATATPQSASVKGGGPQAPYFGAIDYGNVRGSGAGVGRGDSGGLAYDRGGRIVYPAVRERQDDIVHRYEKEINDVIRTAGL